MSLSFFSAGYIRHVFAQTLILTVCVVKGSGKKCNECVENGFERYGADKARVKLTGKLIVELCSAECHTFTTIIIHSIGKELAHSVRWVLQESVAMGSGGTCLTL